MDNMCANDERDAGASPDALRRRGDELAAIPRGSDDEYAFFTHDLPVHVKTGRCPVNKAVDVLAGKWVVRVTYQLLRRDTMRFGELQRGCTGITPNVLASTLRTMEKYGLVTRRQYNEIPPHTDYSLTERGRALTPVLFELSRWGERLQRDEQASEGLPTDPHPDRR